jgi:NAD(P)-dependent dehydrogenase (short-subunit alcohol dehydrogenase family)
MTTAQIEPDAAQYACYPSLRGRTVFITGGATGIGAEFMPADIARMALWLAADDGRMCTAQTWVVDGGWT